MRILYCIPSLKNSGGTERILTEKVNFLSENCHYEIFIVTTEMTGVKPFFKLNKNIKVIELDINFNTYFDAPILKKIYHTKRKLKVYQTNLKKCIVDNNIDVCVSTGAKELEFLFKFNNICKTICELHFFKSFRKDFISTRTNNIIYNIIGNYRTKQLIQQTKKINKLIVLTKADEKEWKKTNQNVIQIYNFTSFEGAEASKLQNKKVIAVGRLEPEKGFDMLIEAWNYTAKFNEGWELNIFGSGSCENELLKKIDNLGIKNINLRGNSKNLKEHYLDSSFFVLSSRYEGFALALLEAMSCGLPVISFDCLVGPREILGNSESCILVNNGDVEDLGKAILEYMTNPSLLLKKSLSSKSEVEKYSKKNIMKQWIDLFQTLKT